ncbi:MAG TPA: hypothetical protein VEL76_21110 [Gemmataceae bacterium]|nr:hypothetical protein [Gemmataceae bacterium]
MAQQTNTQQGAGQGKANGISKMEAVRRTLGEMGHDATPSEMQAFIKRKFGIEMSPNHVSACKVKLRDQAKPAAAKPAPKPAAAPQPAAPEPQTAAPQQGTAKASSISKKEAVRQALKELGKGAKPAAIKPFIKAKYGIDMTPEHITTSKGEILRGKGGKGKAAKKQLAAPKAPAKPPLSTPSAATPAGGTRASSGNAVGSISLQDVETTKDLVGRVGADSLRTLIELLAK